MPSAFDRRGTPGSPPRVMCAVGWNAGVSAARGVRGGVEHREAGCIGGRDVIAIVNAVLSSGPV